MIVILGDSILMSSLENNLKTSLVLNVIRVEDPSRNIVDYVKLLRPELIIFELDVPRPCTILSLLREQPETLLLGVDTNDSQVFVLNSNRHVIESMQEFCQLAHAKLEYKAQAGKGGNETGMVESVRYLKMD